MPEFKFGVEQIQKIRLKLETKTAANLSDISAIVLTNYATELASILIYIYRISYNSNIFSRGWNRASA